MDAQLATRNDRYLQETVATAPPSKLLTLLYDRLVRDLSMGEKAIVADDRSTSEYALGHARDIITELLVTLDGNAWPGAGGLAQVYTWMLAELIGAGVARDAERVAPVRAMVEDLRTAWHEAAGQLSPSPQSFTA